MKKLFTLVVLFLTLTNYSKAQCWFVDDATNSVCQTDPSDSCVPITYPDGSSANFIEALSIDPSGVPVYAADAGQVGILDPMSGIFTPFPNSSGYNDLDGLAWNASSGKLYASARFVGTNDTLIVIETTGPNAGLAEAGSAVGVSGSGPDIDELAVPPINCSNSGILYASIYRSSGFVLATIDPTTGIATEIGAFGIPDVESITFDAGCNLYGNTGGGDLYLIDQVTGAVIGDPIVSVNGSDVEGMSCAASYPFGASISNYIWEDANGDGMQDSGEMGIEGVIVALLDEFGSPILDPAGNPITTITDINGEYIFNNLPAANYIVQLHPSNYLPGGALDGYDQTFDEDGGSDGEIAVSLDTNEEYVTADFGFQGNSSIGDTIWADMNGDGIQNVGEYGIEGVTVTLYNATGNILSILVTDSNGNYDFLNLPPGDYTVSVNPPEGYDNTGDLDGVFDNSTVVTLGANDDVNNLDFGYQGMSSISNYIWEDVNGDGIQDLGENGIMGVIVALYDLSGSPIMDAMGNPITAITNSVGEYMFSNLPPGSYSVEIDDSNFLAGGALSGFGQTFDEDGGDEGEIIVFLGNEMDHTTADFGFQFIVLPIKLVQFNAVLSSNNAILSWTTAQEIENDYFDIEYSTDGRTFKKVGQVKGQGNSSKYVDYNFIQNDLAEGIHYFKLRQVDFNGDYTYSDIKEVNLRDFNAKIKVFPNPTTDYIQIVNSLEKYSIYDLKGEQVLQGVNTGGLIDLTTLTTGIYILKLESNLVSKTMRIVKI